MTNLTMLSNTELQLMFDEDAMLELGKRCLVDGVVLATRADIDEMVASQTEDSYESGLESGWEEGHESGYNEGFDKGKAYFLKQTKDAIANLAQSLNDL